MDTVNTKHTAAILVIYDLSIGIGIGIFNFSNQTHINMYIVQYISNEVTILRDDTVWLTSGCPDSRSRFHPVTPSTVHGTTVAQWSHSRHLTGFGSVYGGSLRGAA